MAFIAATRSLPLETTVAGLSEKLTELASELTAMTKNAQSSRGTVASLETTVKTLTRQNEELESQLKKETTRQSELLATPEKERDSANTLARDFENYKKEHRLSGDLGALQAAVLALQTPLQERRSQAG